MARISKKAARNKIEKLVAQFLTELPAIKRGAKVKEAHVEQKYIKPMFQALNWNTDNEGLPLNYEEFVVQATQQVEGTMKAPDYLLRLPDRVHAHIMRKHLFIEAKHPKYDLRKELRWIRQTYLYAHSTFSETDKPENRVRLAVLTDFEQFRLFDCIDPEPLTKNSIDLFDKQVVPGFEWTCQSFVDEFDRLWDTFERDNVAAGSLDALCVTPDDKIAKRVAPDRRFLYDLENFRVMLAKGIVQYNPKLSDQEITAAAQLVLDRIVFVKMLHDRGLEPDHLSELVLALKKQPADDVSMYDACSKVFEEKLDYLYNGSLFKRRDELDDVKVNNHTVRQILTQLQPERAVYTLAAMPVEIIGYAYEKFLGRVIQRDGRTVTAVEKPEVRRKGGVYYTPRHIVENIVRRTVGAALAECAKPEDVRSIRIVDPSCGSGSFLIVAFEYLLEWHRSWFIARVESWVDVKGRVNVPKAYQQLVVVGTKVATGRQVYLTAKLRRELLTNNIFGVDIDEQAVEVTRFSLSMKALEGVSREIVQSERNLYRQQILPDLSKNIQVGNSLIGTDLSQNVPKADRLASRIFDWAQAFPAVMKRGGFDVVIGNPPYDVLEKERGQASWPHDVLQVYLTENAALKPALGRKKNLFRLFVVKALGLLREDGHYGMIVPLSLLADISTAGTRQYLFENTKGFEADCFPQKDNAARRVFRDAKLSTVVFVCQKHTRKDDDRLPRLIVRTYPWDSFEDPCKSADINYSDLALLDPKKLPVPLVDQGAWTLCAKIHRMPGVVRLGTVDAYKVRRGEINQTNFRRFISTDATQARLLKGSEVAPYRLQEPKQGEREWFHRHAFKAAVKTKAYDNAVALADVERIATQRITGVDDSRRLTALIMKPSAHFADSTNAVLSRGGDLHYLLGLINSELWQWRFRLTSTNNNVQTNELESMPFRVVDPAAKAEKASAAAVVALVQRIINLYDDRARERGAARETIERDIAATERQINDAVYALYGLSAAERDIVRNTDFVAVADDEEDDEDA